MKKEEALNLLGGTTDEYWSEFYDTQRTYYSTLEEYVWAGLFGFCCCGDPQRELDKIKEALSCTDKRQPLPDELQIYGYILDNREYTEHGSSIYSAWLTPKGEALLILLNELD